jgi:hypothetical protein
MAATFDVKLDRGGTDATPGSSDTVTNLRFKTNDDNTQDTNDPIPIVTGQTKRSYWRQVYLEATGAPATQVDNVKFYTDGGGFGTGITLQVGEQFPTKNSGSDAGYEVATGTPGDTGDEVVAGHAGVSSVVDAFGKTSGSPLSGPSISEAGSIIDDIGDSTNYIILQVDVIDTASSGSKSAETITFQYDEI